MDGLVDAGVAAEGLDVEARARVCAVRVLHGDAVAAGGVGIDWRPGGRGDEEALAVGVVGGGAVHGAVRDRCVGKGVEGEQQDRAADEKGCAQDDLPP